MIKTDAGGVDLEDAKVLRIRRSAGQIQIVVDHAKLCQKSSRGDVEEVALYNVTVVADAVTEERAEHFVGDRVTAPHPDPDLPLDTIEVVEHEPGILRLQGYREGDAWFVWSIHAGNVGVSFLETPANATQPPHAPDGRRPTGRAAAGDAER